MLETRSDLISQLLNYTVAGSTSPQSCVQPRPLNTSVSATGSPPSPMATPAGWYSLKARFC